MIQEISIAKDAIRDAKELRRFHNLPVDKGLTAAYQILATPPTDHPDVQKLISQMVVLQANHDRLQERDCNASIELCYNDGNDPFARESLTVVDVGVSDNAYVVESKVLSNLQASHAKLVKALKTADKMLEYVGDPQCDGDGAYQDGHGNVYQCQWCAEREEIQQALAEAEL